MASVYKEGKGWTVAWMNSAGKRDYARGLPSKKLANMIGEAKDFARHAAKHGIIDQKQEKVAAEDDRPIGDHLADFLKHLKGKGDTAQYVRETQAAVKLITGKAGIRKLSQLARFPIVRECNGLMEREKGNSRRTRNKVLGAMKAFTAWLTLNDRIAHDVLYREPMLDVQQDRRRVRRAMDEEQMLRLIETTATQKTRGGMTGIDRMMRYTLGFATGFRQGTLFSLKPGDFHLDDRDDAFIHVIATNVKSRKEFDLPIDADLVDLLRPWLAGKPKSRPVFTKLPHGKPMNAYRQDLKAAGIPYHEAGTNEFCDQHAQRNTFITNVIRVAGLKVAQDMAQHSTPDLTSKYGRLGMSDYRKAMAAMPKVKRTDKKPESKKNAG